MFNLTLLWLFIVPVVFSIGFVLLARFIHESDTGGASLLSAIGFALSIVIISSGFYLGKGSKTADQEWINGKITAKSREHGSYTRSYPCNCTTSSDSKGNSTTTCQTCYEDHYTVDWLAHSTLGNFTLESLDETSSSVYDTPDPVFYTNVRIGEPCAKQHNYTNYIKAVPESLFRPAGTALKAQFASLVPAYPANAYDIWRVDRVLPAGVNVPDLSYWNTKLSTELEELGPQKQANVIVVLVKSSDPNYLYALQDAWLNGKKNDIIIVIGTTQFPQKADWVGVLALTDKELFKVKLRDDIMALDTLTADNVIDTISTDTKSLFVRKRMHDFAYLDAEIDPPLWVEIVCILLSLAVYIGFFCYAGSIATDKHRSYRYY